MQNQPEKVVGNYNELAGTHPPIPLPMGIIQLQSDERYPEDWPGIIKTGVGLVTSKVAEILGDTNKLTVERLALPIVRLIQSDPEHPNWAGYFSSDKNEITLITDKIATDPISRTKVLVHELLHFLSHNGRDDAEHLDSGSPISRNNNVGFHRSTGLDIREGSEGTVTDNYFLSFNEGVTEQLTIDILPGIHEVYGNYRGLLNQVIDDAIIRELGSKGEDGIFLPWSRERVKDYIYTCFFGGNLTGFTNLLNMTYEEYDISEQQFGLMTDKDDLPSIIKQKHMDDNPGGPPPTPTKVVVLLQQRLDNKTAKDYVSDIIGPEPGEGGGRSKYGDEYDSFVESNEIKNHSKEYIEGIEYDIDSNGFIIYRGNDALLRFDYITDVFDDLINRLKIGEVDSAYVTQQIDGLLFDTYKMSMLSDGFRKFYIYKHTKTDNT